MNALRSVGVVVLAIVAAALFALVFIHHSTVSLAAAIAPEFLRLDFGLSDGAAPFLAGLAIVTFAVAAWSAKYGGRLDGFLLALFAAAMAAVLVARSALAFFLCWEVMSLVSIFLVATDNDRREVRRASFTYALVSQFGALCILLALAILVVNAGSGSFDAIAAHAPALPKLSRLAIIALAIGGFGSKAGLVPLHFWLPRAHPIAPANASAMLSGIMLNIAIYGLVVTCFSLASPVPIALSVALLGLGLASALIGALHASIESEMKRLLAFSSIENVGFIVAALALASLATALRQPALATAALFAMYAHALNHGVFKALLFLGAGTLVARMDHLTDLDRLGGIAASTLRRSAPFVFVGMLTAAALPPFGGFVSEWLIFRAFALAIPGESVATGLLAIAAIAMLALAGGLAAAAFVKAFGTAFLGAPRSRHDALPETTDASVIALTILAAACVLLGVIPAFLLAPLARIASAVLAVPVAPLPNIAVLPLLGALPLLLGTVSVIVARARRVERVPPWACGSSVTTRSQYTATVLSRPIRVTFALMLKVDLDDVVRSIAARVQQTSRKMRLIQSGRLSAYIAYALVVVGVMLVLGR